MQPRIALGILATTLLLAACSPLELPEEPQDQPTELPPDNPPEIPSEPDGPSRGTVVSGQGPRMAIINYTKMDLSDPEMLAEYSRAEMIVTTPVGLWGGSRNEGKVDEMRAINPDLKVIGYLNAHSTWLSWDNAPDRESSSNPYGWDWFHATKPYWSYTTTGDTMMSWPGKVLLNILDPACRTAMIGVVVDHWDSHSNVLDGVFWDHFNNYLWVPDFLPGVDGQMDLDGDGIAHRNDEDEMAAYRRASEELITELRNALGEEVIQIVNGGRAAKDSVFTAMVDGMMYENFPQVGFRQGDIRLTVDPQNPNNLFAAQQWPKSDNGGPWLILSNRYRTTFIDDDSQAINYPHAEFSRVIAALTGSLVSFHPEDQSTSYGWPDVELNLGLPVGSAIFGEDTVSREFENGSVWLQFRDGGPFPFDFEFMEDGLVAQSLAFPAHFP